MKPGHGNLVPSIALLVGAAFWGLYWVPIRAIEQAGIPAFWTGPVLFGASVVVLVPLFLLRWRQFVAHWRDSWMPGLLAGSAFALYIVSLNLTDVVRAILLFYMSPLWSTLLGVVLLHERLTVNRIAALLLALLGLYIVLMADSGLPLPRNTGDWYALISGLCWSFASVKLFQDGARFMIEKVTIFVICALLMSLMLAIGSVQNTQPMPSVDSLSYAWPWITLVALSMLPITYLTIWPATLLSPARVGMLLMMEVIVGVGSAALYAGDPFGWREFIGALLIMSAAVVEVWRQQQLDQTNLNSDQA